VGSNRESNPLKTILGNITKGLPSLLGVLWGILLYRPGFSWVLQVLTVFGISVFFLWLGRKVIGRNPIVGWILIEFWVLSAIAVVALSTLGILWLTVNAPSFLVLDESKLDAVAGALVGAVTTFLAILWIKDIEGATGPFWPSTQFKKGISSAFSTGQITPPVDTRAWDAVYEDRVRKGGPIGWDFAARYERVLILKEYVKKRGQKS
jgi:hypothetical protein